LIEYGPMALASSSVSRAAGSHETVMAAYMTEIRLSTEAIAAIAKQLRGLSQELE